MSADAGCSTRTGKISQNWQFKTQSSRDCDKEGRVSKERSCSGCIYPTQLKNTAPAPAFIQVPSLPRHHHPYRGYEAFMPRNSRLLRQGQMQHLVSRSCKHLCNFRQLLQTRAFLTWGLPRLPFAGLGFRCRCLWRVLEGQPMGIGKRLSDSCCSLLTARRSPP